MPDLFHFSLHTSHRHDQFNEVFLSRTVRSLAVSLVGFFVPIYIVNSYGGNVEDAFPLIIAYFLVVYFFRLTLAIPAAKLVSYLGTKTSLVLAGFVNIAWLASLIFLDQSTAVLFASAILYGINSQIFFTSHHAHFSISTKKSKSSKQMSNVLIMRKVAASLGPLIGGVIATVYGFQYALIAGMLVTLISLLFLDIRHDLHLNGFRLQNVFKDFNSKQGMALFGWGMQSFITLSAWPLFISLLIGSYDGIGLVVTASLLLSIVIMHLTGAHGSTSSEKRQLKLGSRASAGVHIFRAGASNPFLVGGINFLNDIAYSIIAVPFIDSYYSSAKRKKRTLSFIAGMEMMNSLGVLTMILIGYVSFVYGSVQIALLAMFIVGSLSVLLTNFIIENR